ncbi:MAG: hypothetical protein L6Q54_13495 [Leptospiraceae bacterium]|nr:hypothetical protein [Leptospiraceae bacterium]MCK6382248.1 hypothetical protein [Leptospiraceae bacterium]NUM40683.1 hypothetical protein [Leptospiraceae bacterium]
MLKSFLLVISIIFYFGNCEHHHESSEHHHAKAGYPELDNGKKWQSDSPTKSGFAKLTEDLKKFEDKKKGKLTVQDYNEFAKISTASIDSIFASCTMKGKSHEELHKYIALLLEDIKSLKGNELNSSKESFEKLKTNLGKFNDFFE